MANTRYLLVSMGREEKKLPVHHLLANYHWHRLNDDVVLTLGNYGVSAHANLHSHAKVSILPHSVSMRKLKDTMRPEHFQALQSALDLEDNATMGHMLDRVEERMGPLMHPYK